MFGNGEVLRVLIVSVVTALLTHFGFALKPPKVDMSKPTTPKKEVQPDDGQGGEDTTTPKKKKKKKQPPKGEELSDPTSAIGRIQFGNAGCTATVIGPRNSTGYYDVLTAAHCIHAKGQVGQMSLRDGRKFSVKVVTYDERADCCWLTTIDPNLKLPTAKLLARTPSPGDAVWHCGFGIDKPGNVERGRVIGGPNGQGQVEFWLSVSSGDSGGAIVHAKTGRVISPVCCTSRLSGIGSVFGACPEASTALRPSSGGSRSLESPSVRFQTVIRIAGNHPAPLLIAA